MPGWDTENIVPAVNRARVQFDQLGISGLVKVAGPFMLFYEQTDGQEVTVNVALPAAEEPAELPPPAHYRVLPAHQQAARRVTDRSAASRAAARCQPTSVPGVTGWPIRAGLASSRARPASTARPGRLWSAALPGG